MGRGLKSAAFALILALNAGMFAAGSARAQDTVLADVVVEASPQTPALARRYVGSVADPPLGAVSLATWQTPICVGTQNLKPVVAQVLTDRLTMRAAALGVATRTSGCAQTVTILGSVDGKRSAELLLAGQPRAFKASANGTQQGPDDRRRFAERDAPVRWWTISAEYDTYVGHFTESLWGSDLPPRQTSPITMFNQSLVRAMVQTLVVLDVNKAGNVSLDAVGDYIAMVVLAEVDPDAPVRAFPTVMNLFQPDAEVAGMTAWDQRYLQALYCARVRQPGSGRPLPSGFQLSEIARLMTTPTPPRHKPNGSCA